jgi:hypothetical protein
MSRRLIPSMRPAAGAHRESPVSAAMAAAIALIAWVALALQTDITVHRLLLRGFDLTGAIERLAGYLTNLTVFMVALCFSCVALRARSLPGQLLRRPAAVTAVVVCMVFVGIAYNLLLRHLWTPSGGRAWLNETLHTVIPLLCAIYWLSFVPRFQMTLRGCLLWFVYPLGYLLVTFWRGSTTDFYPYPFIDVGQLGYARVLINTALLLASFVALMATFAAINARRRPAVAAIPSEP